MAMPRTRSPLPPLSAPDLDRLALRYVERFATTRGRLGDYLRRKIRERGWEGAAPPDPAGVAQRMADRGYVDDRLYAEAKAGALGRRGMGARRVAQALRQAGVEEDDAASVAPIVAADAPASALAFARRRRIGPFAREAADRAQQQKQLAAMLRAGHPMALSRRIIDMNPGEDFDFIVAERDS